MLFRITSKTFLSNVFIEIIAVILTYLLNFVGKWVSASSIVLNGAYKITKALNYSFKLLFIKPNTYITQDNGMP